MSDAPISNRLSVLAADIRAAHEDVARGALAIAERALSAGRMLAEAKSALPHGEWTSWLSQQVGMSARSARRYMQMARSGVEAATVASLGVRGSMQGLALNRVPRPAIGHCAEAVFNGEVLAAVWRDRAQPERFHVLVVGKIQGQDHSLCATSRPVPDELLSRCVAEAGFPLGSASFHTRTMDDVLLHFREMAVSGEACAP